MVTHSTVGEDSAASLEITNFENFRRGYLSPRLRQTRSCENAKAVAALREETSSLRKMFWT